MYEFCDFLDMCGDIAKGLDEVLAERGFDLFDGGGELVGEDDDVLYDWYRAEDEVDVVVLFAKDGIHVSVETECDVLDSWIYAYGSKRMYVSVGEVVDEAVKSIPEE